MTSALRVPQELMHTRAVDCTRALEDSGYRVLAPFAADIDRQYHERPAPEHIGVLGVLDTETTDDDDDAEIIQLALTSVLYDRRDKRVIEVMDTRAWWNEPTREISAEASRVHGITLEMVKGHRIDVAEVQKICDTFVLGIAHNAQFDAPKIYKLGVALRWACSLNDIDWRAFGYEQRALRSLLQDHTGTHFKGHDARRDVRALAHILASPLPDGTYPLAHLLPAARSPRFRIIADGTPYEGRQLLKARNYRWNPERRIWHREVISTTDAGGGIIPAHANWELEAKWLRDTWPFCTVKCQTLNPWIRFLPF